MQIYLINDPFSGLTLIGWENRSRLRDHRTTRRKKQRRTKDLEENVETPIKERKQVGVPKIYISLHSAFSRLLSVQLFKNHLVSNFVLIITTSNDKILPVTKICNILAKIFSFLLNF